MITRTFSKTGARSQVTFKLKIAHGITGASVVGDFNNWTPGADELKPDKSGYLTKTVSLPSNKRFAFKYLTNNGMWLTDNSADDYQMNEWGESNSIVDTTAPADLSPATSKTKKKATKKKATTKKKSSAKKTAKKKTAAKTKSGKKSEKKSDK